MSLTKESKAFKSKTASSRIPVAQACTNLKSLLDQENGAPSSRQKFKVIRRESGSSITTMTIARRNIDSRTKTRGFLGGENGTNTSDIFVWKTGIKHEKSLGDKEVTCPISFDSEEKKIERDIKTGTAMNGTALGECFLAGETGQEFLESVHTDKGTNGGIIEIRKSEENETDTATINDLSLDQEMVTLSAEVLEDINENNKNTHKDRSFPYTAFQRFSKTSQGSDMKMEQDDQTALREQIEKLSSFIETSEDLRERSELLLTQQRKKLEEEARDKDEMKNKVCCLEELRRNLQCKLDGEFEEKKALEISLKNVEKKLYEEKEKLKIVKKECSSEISKNAELEVVLQTILQELGSANKLLKMNSEGTGLLWNRYSKGSINYNTSSEENWKRERSQFQGKIKLLELDKKKLCFHIDELREIIVQHEHNGLNIREKNEVLEFRIIELEMQLSELIVKKYCT